mgnify:CR=1 FL=1
MTTTLTFTDSVLTSLNGLSNVTTVPGDLKIFDNDSLCQSVVDAFVAGLTVNGTVTTYGNDDGC